MMEETKTCKRCGLTKPLSAFAKYGASQGDRAGLPHASCRMCYGVRTKELRAIRQGERVPDLTSLIKAYKAEIADLRKLLLQAQEELRITQLARIVDTARLKDASAKLIDEAYAHIESPPDDVARIKNSASAALRQYSTRQTDAETAQGQ